MSLAFGRRLAESGLVASMGTVGDSYDTQSMMGVAPAGAAA